jgi:hypothetical protein
VKRRRSTTSVLVWVAIGVAAAIVARSVIMFVGGDPSIRTQIVLGGLITAAGVVLVVGLMIIGIAPNAARARRLSTALSNALVANARMSSSVRRLIHGDNPNPETRQSAPALTVCLVVDDKGISFWHAGRRPKQLATIEWADIRSISIEDVAPGLTSNQSISIALRSDDSKIVSLSIASSVGFGLALIKGPELINFIDAVLARRPQGAPDVSRAVS